MRNDSLENNEAPRPSEAQEHELTELLNEVRNQAYRIALRIMHNPADAEDVLQESMLKAYRNLPQFRGESNLSTWLGTIVTNQAITALRRRFSRNEVSLEKSDPSGNERVMMTTAIDPGDSPETEAMKAEFRMIFAKCIEELDEKLRVIFVMREMGEFSIEELAEILELSVPAARSRYFKARKRLHDQLRKHIART